MKTLMKYIASHPIVHGTGLCAYIVLALLLYPSLQVSGKDSLRDSIIQDHNREKNSGDKLPYKDNEKGILYLQSGAYITDPDKDAEVVLVHVEKLKSEAVRPSGKQSLACKKKNDREEASSKVFAHKTVIKENFYSHKRSEELISFLQRSGADIFVSPQVYKLLGVVINNPVKTLLNYNKDHEKAFINPSACFIIPIGYFPFNRPPPAGQS